MLGNTEFITYYAIDEKNYEFNFEQCVPEAFEGICHDSYQRLLESGNISSSLKNSTATILNEPEDKLYLVVLPVISSEMFNGLVIIKFLNDDGYLDSPLTLKIFMLATELMAGMLERNSLKLRVMNLKEVMEQKIAAKTISLTKSHRDLNDIINSVETGILVIDNKTNKILRANNTASSILEVGIDILVEADAGLYLEMDDDDIFNKNGFESRVFNSRSKQVPVFRSVSMINYENRLCRFESFFDISKHKDSESALRKANEILELKVQERTEELSVLIHKLKNEIAERKIAEIEIRKMFEKEKELNELKSRFVSMVSHEFRTPLTVIKSAAQILTKFKGKISLGDKDEYLSRIVNTVDFMTDLIENVIFIGKPTVNSSPSQTPEYNIVELCDSILDEIKTSFSSNREILFTYSNPNITVSYDQKLIRLILINLLSNAVKYSEENTKVDLVISQEDSKLYICVRDRGIGIPPEEQEKIFDLFYRAANVGSILGTGLGMPVILQSLSLLNGSIEIDSKVENGSEFKVQLPLGN